ncbi:MAG: sigma-70 family RNA polymerase sigma factor [Caldilineaceae bacterium]
MTDVSSLISEANNTQLVQRCLQGDAGAWQQLVTRYARLVHSVPVRYGLTPTEVDDIGQEVFLALAQNLHQLEDPERLPAWLLTTARRLSWRTMQKRKQEQPATEGDLSDVEWAHTAQSVTPIIPTINELLTGWQHQEALRQAMQRLQERCQTLLTLIFLDASEPSYDEISERLGIPKGSIGPTRNRCLQQLRSILEGLGFGSEDIR